MPITPIAANDENIRRAAKLLHEGRLVAFPTETVYGLGADARQGAAVARIFKAKDRPTFNPLIIHVATMEMARHYGLFTKLAEKLA
ncbi:MAG: Sua5/YciO/YrdC/YwlC family protein, partial [Alphaproteobacteria bacterium]|nr:Sua5/YciO/YrdC/YwlC family protein [Alphaproteobacteria bacterium]